MPHGSRAARLLAALGALALALACGSGAAGPAATSRPATAAPSAAAAPTSAPSAPAASGATATSPPSVKLRVPYVAISVSQLPAWVAQDAGTFAKNGLDVSLQYIPTGSTLIQTMVAGEADFGIAGSEAPIGASLGGSRIVILAPTVDRLLFEVYAGPAVADAAAMRGRRIGITRVGSSTDFAARQWIQSLGLRPGDDMAIVQLGGQQEILAGLQSGAADAGVLSPPTDVEARRVGMHEIADLSKLEVPFYQSSVLATGRVIDEQPDVVRRFVRAIVEANAIIHQDKAAAKQALARYSQSDDEEVLESSYETALPAIPKVPLPTRAAVESAIELLSLTNPAARGVDPDRFYDPRFVQELQDSGFIDSLYR